MANNSRPGTVVGQADPINRDSSQEPIDWMAEGAANDWKADGEAENRIEIPMNPASDGILCDRCPRSVPGKIRRMDP